MYEETGPVPPPMPLAVTKVEYGRSSNFTLPIDPFAPVTANQEKQQLESYMAVNLRKGK